MKTVAVIWDDQIPIFHIKSCEVLLFIYSVYRTTYQKELQEARHCNQLLNLNVLLYIDLLDFCCHMAQLEVLSQFLPLRV